MSRRRRQIPVRLYPPGKDYPGTPQQRGLAAALCGLCLIVSPGGLAAQADSDQARELRLSGAILSLEHFVQRASDLHPGRVIDAKLKWEDSHGHYVYEIEILDHQGEVWELEFNARNGLLIERDKDGD